MTAHIHAKLMVEYAKAMCGIDPNGVDHE